MLFLGSRMRRIETRGAEILTICSVDPVDLLGYESDALVWYRVVRHVGSFVLATYDVG